MSPNAASGAKLAFWVAPLGWLWFLLINQLRVEWSVNPQYHYAWVVPFLSAYLLWRRIRSSGLAGQPSNLKRAVPPKASSGSAEGAKGSPGSEVESTYSAFGIPHCAFWSRGFSLLDLLLVTCVLLYMPIRLVQEANPDWRLVSWAMALIVIAITLFALPAFGFPIRVFGFPLAFFLVAVPWPTLVEGPLVRALTGANIATSLELLNGFGIPAVQHGNVIEVANGVVGIDEACSGIRSFQATLMLSLFIGEVYRLSALKRVSLCAAGILLSFIFNVGRTVVMTMVAAREGIGAVGKWHDPAGITILVGCFTCLWLIALALRKSEALNPNPTPNLNRSLDLHPLAARHARNSAGSGASAAQAVRAPSAPSLQSVRALQTPGVGKSASRALVKGWPVMLCAWVVVVEIGTELWYRTRERHLPPPITWSVQWPTEATDFQDLPFPENARRFLRFDEGRNAAWRDANSRRWQAIFLRWEPGRIGVHVARSHTPEGCLTAAGRTILRRSDVEMLEINGLVLPVRFYGLRDSGQFLDVLYSHWEDRASGAGRRIDPMQLTYRNRLESVLSGRRNLGQRSIELAVWGCATEDEARATLQAQLEKMVIPSNKAGLPAKRAWSIENAGLRMAQRASNDGH